MIRPPKDERIKYNVDYLPDTDFSAYARLLQSKWRDKKGFPQSKLGNFLDVEFAKTSKANFLTDNIKQLVTQEIANAKLSGALIGEPRVWNNPRHLEDFINTLTEIENTVWTKEFKERYIGNESYLHSKA